MSGLFLLTLLQITLMQKSAQALIVVACVLLSYAMLATILNLPGNELCASLAVLFFILSLLRTLWGIAAKKKVQNNSDW
jgi:hypothetical protein